MIGLVIRPANQQVHIDIEKKMLDHKGEWFHFELRYSGGNVVDLVIRKFKTYESITNDII